MAITITTADPTLFRIATRVAEHEREITGVQMHAQRQDREIAATKRDVRRVRAEVRTQPSNHGTRTQMSHRGMSAGGIKLSARGGFSVSPQRVLGGGGAFLLFGATTAAANAVRWWEQTGSDVAEKYGRGEALGRLGRGALRQVFATGAEALAESLATLVFRDRAQRSEYMRRVKDFWRQPPPWAPLPMHLLKETEAEYNERIARERAIINEASERAVEFVDRNFTQPVARNAFEAAASVRTSSEAAAIKAALWRANAQAERDALQRVYEHELNSLSTD